MMLHPPLLYIYIVYYLWCNQDANNVLISQWSTNLWLFMLLSCRLTFSKSLEVLVYFSLPSRVFSNSRCRSMTRCLRSASRWCPSMSEHHKTAWGQPRPRFAARYLEASPTHFQLGTSSDLLRLQTRHAQTVVLVSQLQILFSRELFCVRRTVKNCLHFQDRRLNGKV